MVMHIGPAVSLRHRFFRAAFHWRSKLFLTVLDRS
jgi:hypothetical protein